MLTHLDGNWEALRLPSKLAFVQEETAGCKESVRPSGLADAQSFSLHTLAPGQLGSRGFSCRYLYNIT